MKTSEIAAYIADKNVRLYIGTNHPFLPLQPYGFGREQDSVGWVAFQLIRCAEKQQGTVLLHNPELGAFGFFDINDYADLMEEEGNVWVKVEFDGYGGLESWKEVAI